MRSRYFDRGRAARCGLAATAGGLVRSATSLPAQRELRDIPNPDPEFERATFQLAEGLEANLFASEPMIRKPIQMAWDQRGRLWVASSETYPQMKPGEPSDDRDRGARGP